MLPVVNWMKSPVLSPLNRIHWPLLAFVSICVAAATAPFVVKLRFSASKQRSPDGLVTFNVAFALCDSEPLAPVTVNVSAPAGVDADVVSVSVDEPAPVTDAGLKLAVTPLARLLALRFTVLLNPFW